MGNGNQLFLTRGFHVEKQATLRSEEISKKLKISFILNKTEAKSYTRMKTVNKCNKNIEKFCYIVYIWPVLGYIADKKFFSNYFRSYKPSKAHLMNFHDF